MTRDELIAMALKANKTGDKGKVVHMAERMYDEHVEAGFAVVKFDDADCKVGLK
jgi:hypothetical protein